MSELTQQQIANREAQRIARHAGLPAPPLIRFESPVLKAVKLPGDALKEIIFARWAVAPCGGCEATMNKMNMQGVAWCRENVSELVAEMRANTHSTLWTLVRAKLAEAAGVLDYAALVIEACDACEVRLPKFTMSDAPTWSVGITTAPRREVTLHRTVEKLIQAGWAKNIKVFAEPATQVPHLPSFVEIVYNPMRLGAFGNWMNALAVTAQENSDLCLILEDDVLLAPDTRAFVEANWPDKARLVSLYQSSLYDKHAEVYPWWRTKEHQPFYGILAMAIPSVVAVAAMADPVLCGGPTEGDVIFGRWADSRGETIYLANQSQHIGDTSTIYPNAINSRKRMSTRHVSENDVGGITAVLSLFKRPHLLERQIENMQQQSVPVDKIWLSMPAVGESIPPENIALAKRLREQGLVDRVWSVQPDPGFQFRWFVAMQAQTEFFYLVDDDTFAGSRWLENCLATIATHDGLIGSLGCIQHSLTDTEKYTRYGAYGPNETVVECDWIGWSYFMRPGAIAPLFAEPFTRERNADDTQLCCRAKRIAGTRCYVPPHPRSDSSRWGSLDPLKYGRGPEAASQNIAPFHADRAAVFIAEKSAGWVPLDPSLR